ncbi:hypothetical protein ABH930_000306 [Kitasatospora sp. GAS204A]|uniref:hypothetical protein n=1 Tax=unclassified Kitasatospora TaxID=2633591 RepID=UPI00247381AF|nr:hypothetical protein [Kitasatospora sp. GAS204B]MDH6116887.1 hypothetical protein [Kitasatospora sp. GAS204B]
MTLQQLAADPNAAITTGQQLLGSLGTGGAALVATTVTYLGVRGKGRLKLGDTGAFVSGVVSGTLYGAAATFWTAPASITNGMVGSITGPAGPFGSVGLGAVATLIAVIAYAADLSRGKSAVLGIAAATVWAEAGGIWSTAAVAVSGVTGHFLGMA